MPVDDNDLIVIECHDILTKKKVYCRILWKCKTRKVSYGDKGKTWRYSE